MLKKKLVLMTIFPLKVTYGGPAAVIKNIVGGLCNEAQYSWEPYVISICVHDCDVESNISFIFKGFKEVFKQRIYCLLKIIPLLEYLLSWIIDLKCVSKLYRDIILFEKILEKNIAKLMEADVIHCHDVYALYVLLSFINKRGLKLKAPLLLEIHSPGSTSEEFLRRHPRLRSTHHARYLRFLEVYAILKAHYVIMPSQGNLHLLLKDLIEIRKVYEALKHKFYVIYNGIEPIKTIPKRKAREKLGIDKGTIVVLSMGRLVYEKGFDRLMKVFAAVTRNFTGKMLLIITGDGPLKGHLKKLAQILNIEHNVILAGYVPRKILLLFFSAADIFASASRRSAFDLALLEAMSAGLPIIANSVGGNIEALDDAGLLAKDEREFTKFFLLLMSNRDLRKTFGLKAYQRFLEKFHVNKMIEVYKKFLNSILVTYYGQ